MEEADEALIGLVEQTAEGFESGNRDNYMNGLQQMLKIVLSKKSVLENPHSIVCKLLDLIIGPSVVGLESYVKAMLAEVAAKVVAKLLANNKEKQILTSEEQKKAWMQAIKDVENIINKQKYENDLVYQLDIIKATVTLI